MKPPLFHGLAAAVLAAGTGFTFASPFEPQTGAQEAAVSTPRTPDGKPDLSGMWNGSVTGALAGVGFTQRTDDSGNIVRLVPSRRCGPNQEGCKENTNQNNDGEFTNRTNANRPLYKPEYWEKVQELDYNLNFTDPAFRCLPPGVPRIGPPTKIVQTASEVIFFYGRPITASLDHDYRIIPIDGRGHDPDAFPTFFGDSVGRWEGDTLVIDAVSFNDITWLANHGGFFHGYDLHVIERLRRDGDTLHYQATVEDPGVLLQPWVMNAQQLKLNRDPKASIREGLPCHDYDSEITVSRIRH
jgi:hypothetical protein